MARKIDIYTNKRPIYLVFNRGKKLVSDLPDPLGGDALGGGGRGLEGQRHPAEGGAQQQDEVARPQQVRVVHQPRVQKHQHRRKHQPVRHMVHSLQQNPQKLNYQTVSFKNRL